MFFSSAQGTVVATPERQDSTVVRPRKRFARETQGYAGPSSIQYGLDVGKSSLRSIGLQADEALESTVPNSVINTQPNSPIQRSGGMYIRLGHICYTHLTKLKKD